MNWRTDKPTADVIVVKIKYIGCYMVLMKKGQDYYSMDNDIGKAPLEVIEKWADLEENETVTDCDQLEKEVKKYINDNWEVEHSNDNAPLYLYDFSNKDLLDAARHFYELGINARKEE